jgi:hypothetical protein
MILGKRGHGKTTLVNRLRQHWKRQIVIDTLGYEYKENDIAFDIESFVRLIEKIKDKESYKVVFRPYKSIEDISKVFLVCRVLRNFVLVLEEASLFCSEKVLDNNLGWLVSYGRHIGCSLIFVARTVPELHIKIRNEVTAFYCFRFTEPRYLKVLEDYGFDSQIIRNLNKFEFVCLGNELLQKEDIETKRKQN